MKIFFAVLFCKVLRVILKIFGKGSSFPGKFVLFFNPNILLDIKLPKYVIAVTGSNGKTSTVELINHILSNNGYTVAYNYEGSNQIEGITTLLLGDSDFKGVSKSDVCLLEVDERYAEETFSYFAPTHLLVSNLFRDQTTRNGNREWVYSCIERSISSNMNLILNADDPLSSLLASKADNVVYYGIDKVIDDDNKGIFDDGIYCPKCNGKLIYHYRHFDNLGYFECSNCGHKKHETTYTIHDLNLNESYIAINNKKISLGFSSFYNAYNSLAAYSLARELNIDENSIIHYLNNYELKNKRIIKFDIDNKKGIFLASKHENPVSYNQSMNYIRNYKKDVSVLIVVDKISRKYFTSETSWLWDIDFNLLNTNNVRKIIISGKYTNDLALRLEYTNINEINIEKIDDIKTAVERLANVEQDDIFIVTCFSDQANVLSKVYSL